MATDEPRKDTLDGEPEWLEARAAADFLGISERRLHQLRRRGEIPGTAVSWRRWRFRVSDLMTYVRHNDDCMPEMRMANAILVTAIENNASAIHLEPDRPNIRVRMRIDGILHEMMAFPPHIQAPLFQRYKIMADCHPLARNIIQQGRIPIVHGKTHYDLCFHALPSRFGESVTLKIYGSRPWSGLNKLGMPPETQAALEWVLVATQGLVLLVSPKDEGATTTAYTALNRLNNSEKLIFTIEEVSSYPMSGVFQISLNPAKGVTWQTATEAALRQSADIIFLDDLNDAERAESALYAAESGVLTLATMTAPNIPVALSRLTNWGISRDRLFSVLGGLLYQRLVRRVCEECTTEYEAILSGTPDMPRETVMLRRGMGCEACRNQGYRGRTGVFEMLYHFPDHLDRPFSSFAHDLRNKVYQGITSVEEAQRLLPYVQWIEKSEALYS